MEPRHPPNALTSLTTRNVALSVRELGPQTHVWLPGPAGFESLRQMAKSSHLQSPSTRAGRAHRTIPLGRLSFDFVSLCSRTEGTLRVARSISCLTSSPPTPSRRGSELVRASHFVQLFNCQGPAAQPLRGGPATGPWLIGLSRPDSKSLVEFVDCIAS